MIDESGIEVDGHAEEAAGGYDLFDNESGMVGSEFEAFFLSDAIDDLIKDRVGKFHEVFAGFFDENVVEVLEAWGRDFDFVGETAEECRVHEVFWIEVSGEDEEFLEWDGEGFSSVEAHEVDAAFEGDDPTVEEVGGADELASEVIDDEATAESLHV